MFSALADGGQVQMPLIKTFFSPRFGMVADKFSVGWMVIVEPPRELIWKAFTEPERMKQWWSPKGFTVVASKMDLRPGVTYHYGMKAPDGPAMWGKMVFRELTPPKRMVFINSFPDKAGGTTRHPMHLSWPLEMLSVFTRSSRTARLKVTIRWSAYNATEEEQKTFDTNHDSMRQGWGGTLDQLAAYLAERTSSCPAVQAISTFIISSSLNTKSCCSRDLWH